MSGYRAIAVTASVAVFMQFLDSTAINTAIPAIAHDLKVPAIDLNVAIIANTLAMVVFVPLGSVLAGRIGSRNAFMLALSLFTIGSIACAFATGLPMLIAARALEGAGGGLMMPLSRLLVVRSASKSELISAMNWLLIPGIIGPLMGPAVGGLLVTYASWHAIFLVNIPIALIGIAATGLLVPNHRDEVPERFDRKGMLLLSPMAIGLVLGLGGIVGPQPAWLTVLLLGSAIGFAIAYYRHYRTANAPLVDLSLYRVDTFRHSMISGNLIRVIFGAAGFLMPLWFQLAMGISAAQTGALMMMSTFGALVSRLFGGAMLRRWHPRHMAVKGAAALAVALLGLALLQPGWPLPLFYLLLAAQGLALSVALMIIVPAAYVDIAPERMAAASSFYSTVQQLTFSLGVIIGVWTITAMRWLTSATPNDGRAYSGSFAILSLFAVGAMLVARRFDPEATGSLRPAEPARA